MAGDPNIEITSKILLKLQENGADLIELGIPYSDPLADGPVIQLAASRALKSGTSLRKVIKLLESLKGKLNIPIILFSYLNPLLCFGFERFCEMASDAGVSGLIVPDLPLEEAYKFSKNVSNHSMDLILLVAPTTPFERMKQISNHTKGFTYLVSVTGVTGERNKMENRVENLIAKLKGITDPEQKRKIIGEEFIRVFEEESNRLGPFQYLAQGTLYPDVIESAGTNIDPKTGERIAVKIKSHHNVGGLPKDLQFKLVEPLRKLFKDEVRKLGATLGLPDEIIKRHPFPGPGLDIRILGEVINEKLDCLRDADWIVRDEINKAGLYNDIWQAFAVLLPVKTVGVMGDKRTYAWPIVLRCVSSEDGMTADWS